MKITELQKQLERALKAYGDIPVKIVCEERSKSADWCEVDFRFLGDAEYFKIHSNE